MTSRTMVKIPLAVLESNIIEVLLDSHRVMFMALYDEDRLRRSVAKARLAEAVASVDLLPLTGDDTHEDYRPA